MEYQDIRHKKYLRQIFLLGVFGCVAALLTSVFITHAQTADWPEKYRFESLLSAVGIPLVIAPIAAVLICRLLARNHRLMLKLERMANFDELTGLNNRREFFRQAGKRQATGKKSAVLLADLDWFKKVNDTYGHAAGDEVLRHVAGLLKRNARSDSFVARLGGEEFSAIFDFESVGDARNQAESLRRAVAETQFVYEGRPILLSMSIGLAIGDANENIETLLKRADEALYRAKDSGRNQTLLAA